MHPGVCHRLSSWQQIPQYQNLILINVKRECLVETEEILSHCAPSYVWGTQPSLATTKSNFRALCEPGIL
jgi:hypothetical protein